MRFIKNLFIRLFCLTALCLAFHEKLRAQCEAYFKYVYVDSFDTYLFSNASTGDGVHTFVWEFGDGGTSTDENPTHRYDHDGVFNVCLSIVDSAFCFNHYCESIVVCNDCVWPGDANNNGIVNNHDLLPIGLAFNNIGPERPDTSIDWSAHITVDWSGIVGPLVFENGTDFKHADCNGDGIVNELDVEAILENYREERVQKTTTAPELCADPEAPLLYFEFPEDSLEAGSQVSVLVKLGTAAVPADSVYGIAFTINYNSIFIDSSTMEVDFSTSEFGPDSLLFLSKNHFNQDNLDLGITRFNHQNVTVFGTIAVVSFVMEDDLISKASTQDIFSLYFSDVLLIKNDETPVSVCPQADSIMVYEIKTGIENGEEKSALKIFPNPARERIFVWNEKNPIQKIELSDLMGNKLKEIENIENRRLNFNVSNLPQGFYILRIIEKNNKTTVHKIEIFK